MIYNGEEDIDRKQAIFRFRQLLADRKTFRLEAVRTVRTVKQNSYLHVLFNLYGIEFGWTLEEAKRLIKKRLGYSYKKNGEIFLVETSKMNTKEMSVFIDKFLILASNDGCYLPTAREYKKSIHWYHREIKKFEKYL